MLAEGRGMSGTAARTSHHHLGRLVPQSRDQWSEADRQNLLLPLYGFWSRFQFGTHLDVAYRHRMFFRSATSRSANHLTKSWARRSANALQPLRQEKALLNAIDPNRTSTQFTWLQLVRSRRER